MKDKDNALIEFDRLRTRLEILKEEMQENLFRAYYDGYKKALEELSRLEVLDEDGEALEGAKIKYFFEKGDYSVGIEDYEALMIVYPK